MLVAELVARIEERIETLAGRCHTVADLAELLRRNALPQASPSIFVVPLGLVARGDGEAGTGYFIQSVDETFAVLIFARSSGDITGGKALMPIDETIDELIGAICGWGPEEAIGVFHLRRGQLHSANAGGVFYQLDFGLQQQVRVLS